MGFKVTVHKNGAKHGEAHYSSEAVAVGMATKMRNAGANVSVARCNGGGCGCDGGMKSNPRHRRNGESGDHTASPFHAVLESYGWVYSHSTPMHRPGGVVTTRHSYGFPSDAAGKKYPRVGFDGSRWSGSMGGSGSEVTGRSAADLAKYLKGARSRGAKKNPRHNGADPFALVRRAVKKEVARYADEGGTFAIQRLMDGAYRAYNKHLTVTGEQLPVEEVTAEIRAARTQAEDLRRAGNEDAARTAKDAYRESQRRTFPFSNPRRNGTTSANAAASRSMAYTHLFR